MSGWTRKAMRDLRDYAKSAEQDEGTVVLSVPAGELYGLADFALKAYDAMCGIEAKIRSGVLVRDISHDHEPEWATLVSHLVVAVKRLKEAIELIELEPGEMDG